MKSNNKTFGILVLVIGVLLLLKQVGVIFPHWLFSWPMILIAIGVITGVRSGFRNTGSLVLLIIGAFFLLRNNNLLPDHFGSYVLPVGLILLGIILLFRRSTPTGLNWEGNFDRFERKLRTGKAGRKPEEDSSDFLHVEAIFCGIKRRMITKQFKGGEVTTIFGGTDIDLSHADIDGSAVLDVSVVFGGMKLIVPSHWEVNFEVSNIAAGVEDKRFMQREPVEAGKKLVITGAVIFGGIEISSF
jgi:predicted membrane protein